MPQLMPPTTARKASETLNNGGKTNYTVRVTTRTLLFARDYYDVPRCLEDYLKYLLDNKGVDYTSRAHGLEVWREPWDRTCQPVTFADARSRRWLDENDQLVAGKSDELHAAGLIDPSGKLVPPAPSGTYRLENRRAARRPRQSRKTSSQPGGAPTL